MIGKLISMNKMTPYSYSRVNFMVHILNVSVIVIEVKLLDIWRGF